MPVNEFSFRGRSVDLSECCSTHETTRLHRNWPPHPELAVNGTLRSKTLVDCGNLQLLRGDRHFDSIPHFEWKNTERWTVPIHNIGPRLWVLRTGHAGDDLD